MRWLLFLLALSVVSLADDSTHKYEDADEVVVWLNKVGPYHNPQETYSFYSLPFCQPNGKALKRKSDSLGAVLEGNELTDSGLVVKFKEPQAMVKICDLSITAEIERVFTDAVKEHYWYQMYIDELPVWGMVGEYMMAEAEDTLKPLQEQGFIYTHKDFSIAYNGDQIIEVNLTSENPRPIVAGETHPMTYSVSWMPTEKTFARRFDRYLDFEFFEHQIHWFSIFNSFMMVVFLCGLVALILMRTLKNDYARYTSDEDDLELDHVVDESGWKQVHGDVFRAPKHLMLYAALIGTGYQLIVLTACVISLAFLGSLYDERGAIVSTFVGCYALTAGVAAYTSAGFYKRYDGKDWKQCMILTTVLFPALWIAVALVLNMIAIAYESSNSLSVASVFYMLAVFLFGSMPLSLLGTFAGRSQAQPGDFPCRVNSMHRPIPNDKWYTKPLTLALFSGVLPFGSIFIEMYFIFTSFWGLKYYFVFGFMLLVFCILIIVTICVTIVATYFLLNAEDYRWHWTSFFSGGSTALYVYLYSIYYFFTKTRMTGLLQTAFYFGYMGVFCISLFTLCGTIGYIGTNLFVRKIYSYIKSD